MKIARALGVAAAAALLVGCEVEVQDENKNGLPEDVDVAVDSAAVPDVDLPDVSVDTQHVNVPVPDIDVSADSDSARR